MLEKYYKYRIKYKDCQTLSDNLKLNHFDFGSIMRSIFFYCVKYVIIIGVIEVLYGKI